MPDPIAYRLAATWGAFARPPIPTDATVVVAPADPGARNGIQFLYTNFTVELNSFAPGFRAAAASAVAIPVALPAMPRDVDGGRLGVSFVGFQHILRGSLTKDADVRAVVVVNAAGTTKVFEYPYGLVMGIVPGAGLPPDLQETFFAPVPTDGAGDPPAFPAVPDYGAEVTLVVERRTADARALLILDGIDVTAVFTSPDGPPPAPAACPSKSA